MAALGYRTTPTPTPTDSWSSYFDSWRNEDMQVPAFEPMIVDEDLHPDSFNVNFNFANLDYDLDWEMDLSQDPIDRKIMYDASERVHQRRQQYYHHLPSSIAKQQSPQHAYGHQQHYNPRQVFRNVNNARQRAPDHRQNDVDRFNWGLESAASATAPTVPSRGTSLGANLNGQWLEEPVSANYPTHSLPIEIISYVTACARFHFPVQLPWTSFLGLPPEVACYHQPFHPPSSLIIYFHPFVGAQKKTISGSYSCTATHQPSSKKREHKRSLLHHLHPTRLCSAQSIPQPTDQPFYPAS
ncbi:hypothetical protein EDD36DRAFT_448098 [Exophiala viscosa]|uniref:Uncharacterized protein n=1 Tax=Exophiala viscosa TaxID=2486360 RepID=A0AAN6DLT9_9EURO|nr:hypothetical protein EDD36DRAFT_448098 [Exophiala viscosa]